MSDIAEVILSITAFLTLACGMFILYKPPRLLKRIKHKEFEAEFVNQDVVSVPAPPAHVAAVTETPPVSHDKAEQAASGEESEGGWFTVIGSDYQEGMRLLRQELADETSEENVVARTAFAMYISTRTGNAQALIDLQQHTARHETHSDAQYWLAMAYTDIGAFDQALDSFREALRVAVNDADRAMAAKAVARELKRRDQIDSAIATLIAAASDVAAPVHRSSLYAEVGDLFTANAPPDLIKASAFRELALRLHSTDSELRFKVAYAYGSEAPALAYYHYHRLLQSEPDNEAAINNKGVAAGSVGLRVREIRAYREAIAKGNTLAAANLAYKLIRNGFVDDAKVVLAEAQDTGEPHRNVLSAIGESADAEDKEDEKEKAITDRTEKIRNWRIRYAEAISSSTAGTNVTGRYVNSAMAIVLQAEDETTVSGSITKADFTATLTGEVEGRHVIRFSWRTIDPPSATNFLAILGRKTGSGLLFREGEALVGYMIEGNAELDPYNVASFEEVRLVLQRPPALPATTAAAPR